MTRLRHDHAELEQHIAHENLPSLHIQNKETHSQMTKAILAGRMNSIWSDTANLQNNQGD